jgi:hypothetical protein
MLEIKRYDDWSEESDITDEAEKIRAYTDYVRKGYFRNGELNDDTEQEIINGVAIRAQKSGLVPEDADEEGFNNLVLDLARPKQNAENDLQLLHEHYTSDFDSSAVAEKERASLIQQYLVASKTNPETAAGLQESVNEILADKNAVRSARIAAVDRGDLRLAAIEEDGGRYLYTGPNVKPETISGELDGLLASGAINSQDLLTVSKYLKSDNGGLTTVAENNRGKMVQTYINDRLKSDANLARSFDDAAEKFRRGLEVSQMSTGERIWDGTKQVAMAPFIVAAEVLGIGDRQMPTADPISMLSTDAELNKRFTQEEIERGARDYIANRSGLSYRSDQPESGIAVDSYGNPIIAAALLPNKAKFDAALAAAPLSEDQKLKAQVIRDAQLETSAPQFKNLILSEDGDAASAYAKAKANGKSDAAFVQEWVSNNEGNYSGMSERAQQLLSSTGYALAGLPVGILSLMGSETATKAMVAMMKDQSDREQYSNLMGDKFGLGFQIVNAVPQVATDVLASIGTGSGYLALKTAMTGGVKATLRNATKIALSQVDEAAGASVRAATAAGGEAATSAAFKEVGQKVAVQLTKTEQLIPVAATSFVRSAGATYGSIYSQLPEDMSHEDKHRNAIGYALGAGLSTAVITTGMSALGLGGVENVVTRRFRPATALDDVAAGERFVPLEKLTYKQAKLLYETVENEGRAVAGEAFQTALRKSVGGAYKNLLRGTAGGTLSETTEETLDQAIQIKLEDAALDQNTPLAEKVNQLWHAAVIGGALGGISSAATQTFETLNLADMSVAMDARNTVLGRIANELTRTGNPATAEVVQRMMNEANAAVREQARLAEAAKATVPARTETDTFSYDRPIKFDRTGQAELDLGTEQFTLPRPTLLMNDVIGRTANVGPYTGTVVKDDTGAFTLKLRQPLNDGTTDLRINARSSDTLQTAGVSIRRRPLMVLGSDAGPIKAGTPYVVPDPKTKARFAFPDNADNVQVLPSLGGINAVLVRNTRMVGHPNVLRDIVVSDVDQVRDLIQHFKLDPNKFTAPPDGQEQVQFELGLFETLAAPVADAEPQIRPPVETRTGELETNPVSDVATVRQNIPDSAALNELLGLIALRAPAEVVRETAGRMTPDELSLLDNQIRAAEDEALRIDESKAAERKVALDSLNSVRVALDQLISVKVVEGLDSIQALAPTPTPTPTPTPATAPLETPAPPATEPIAKAARKRKPKQTDATGVKGISVVENSEDSLDDLIAITQERLALEDQPVATGPDGKPMTIADLEAAAKEAKARQAQAESLGLLVDPSVDATIENLDEIIAGAKSQIEGKRKEIDEKAKELEVDPALIRAEDDANVKEVLTEIQKLKPPKQPKTVTARPPIPAPAADFSFRNETEATQFASWVSRGYLVSDLVKNGFSPSTVSDISLSAKKAGQVETYAVAVKKQNLAAVNERYPFFDVPAGTPAIMSKRQSGSMTKAGQEYLELPVMTESEGSPTHGVFTNNPLVTAAQLDAGLAVFVPKDFANDPRLNPSVKLHPSGNGQVIRVIRFPNDTGVSGAGDLSTVGKTDHTPRVDYADLARLNSTLLAPYPQFLDGVGPTLRGRTAADYQAYEEDMLSETARLTEDRPAREGEGATPLTRVGKILLKDNNLTEENALDVLLSSQFSYLVDVKQYGLAKLIENAERKSKGGEINDNKLVSLVLSQMRNETGDRIREPEAAQIISKATGIKGGTPSKIVAEYGRFIRRKLDGQYASGAPSFYGKAFNSYLDNAVKAQKARRTLETKSRTLSIDAPVETVTTGEAGPMNSFESLANLIASDEDVRLSIMQNEESNWNALVNELSSNDEAYDILSGLMSRYGNVDFTAVDMDPADLIDTAYGLLSSQDDVTKNGFRDSLQKTQQGQRLATLLIRSGWLPPSGQQSAIAPSRTLDVPQEQREVIVRQARRLTGTVPTDEQVQELIARARRLTRASSGSKWVKFSRSSDSVMAAGTARTVNSSEANRLGLLNGSPESVIGALERIQETGTKYQKRAAALLLVEPDLIRNTKFVIADFDDVRFAGAYMPKSDLVILNISGHNGRGLADVLLHEYVHAATYKIIKNPTATQSAAVARISALRDLVAKRVGAFIQTDEQLSEAVNDLAEFVSYGITDPKLQSLIKAATPTGQRSLFRRLMEAVMRLFGVEPKTDRDTAASLEDLFDFLKMSAGDTSFRLNSLRSIKELAAEDANNIIELRAVVGTLYGTSDLQLSASKRALFLMAQEQATQEARNRPSVQPDEGSYIGDEDGIDIEGGLEDQLEAEFEQYADNIEAQEQQLPTGTGWLSPNGLFYNAVTGANGGRGDFHAGVLYGLIVQYHDQEAYRYIEANSERLGGVRTIEELSDSDLYELGYALGYIRLLKEPFGRLMVETSSYKSLNSKQKQLLADAGEKIEREVVFVPRTSGSREVVIYDPSKGKQYSIAQLRKYDGINTIDGVEQMRAELPDGVELVESDDPSFEATVDRFGRILVNPENINNRISGLTRREARVVIRGLVNHELGHRAINEEITDSDLDRVAAELGADKLQQVAERYYSATGLNVEEVRQQIAIDRESGVLDDRRLADEWLRSTVTKAVYGTDYEEDLQFARSAPTLLSYLTRAVRAFVNRIRQRFASHPSTETAAAISRAERALRRIDRGEADQTTGLMANRFGDSEAFLSALDGVPEPDRVQYALPVASSNPQKTQSFYERLGEKMYNLPAELRKLINKRDGTINKMKASSKDLIRNFNKLRDDAINRGATMEEIQSLFGTTAPPITNADLSKIDKLIKAFEATLDPALTDGQKLDQIDAKREALKAQTRLRFSEAFRKQQKATEERLTNIGLGELVRKVVAFREDINNFKTSIGFDESNDVYLTTAYKFFTTTGWSLAARNGGTLKVDGQPVDFNKLRTEAAKLYELEARNELRATGRPFTDTDVHNLTLEKLDNYLEVLETAGTSPDRSVINSLRDDLNRFKPKTDIDTAMRALLGQVDDPLTNAVNTMYRVGMLSANQEFRKSFAATAEAIGMASRKTPANANMVRLYNKDQAKTVGPLADLYVDPEIKAVFDEIFGGKAGQLETTSARQISKIGVVLSRISGFAVQSSTRFGLGYWPRNSTGGFLLGAAQGIIFNPFSSKTRQHLMEQARAAFDILPTDEARRNEVLRLIELNVMMDETRGRMYQDLVRGIVSAPEEELLQLQADLEEARITKDAGGVLARIKQRGVWDGTLATIGKGYTKTTDVLSALDNAIDGAYKVNAYYYEKSVIDRHFGNSLTKEEKEEMAASKVKRTFPGHSQVIDAVNSFNRSPMALAFFAFARWKSEVVRTMYNTPSLIKEEIKQGGEMRKRGIRRLIGFTSTLATGKAIVGTLGMLAFRALSDAEDDDDERNKNRTLTPEEMQALREGLPVWQRGHSLFARLVNGKVEYVDMSYVLPHSIVTDIAEMVIEGLRSGEGVQSKRIAQYVVTDIIGAQIAASAGEEILNNKDQFGNPIWYESDSVPAVLFKLLAHFGQSAVKPAAVKKLEQAFRSGEKNTAEIMLGEALGLRPRFVDTSDIEIRGFRSLKKSLDEAVGRIGALSSGRYMDQDRVNEIVDEHQDALNGVQRRMHRFLRSMEGMGSTADSLYSSARAARFSNDSIQSAYAGYRIGWQPHPNWLRNAYENAAGVEEQDPDEKIRLISESLNRKSDVYWINDAD